MRTPHIVRYARRRAGLTQRELAARTGVTQASIARIESGSVSPRADTVERILAACGFILEVAERGGLGVDRSLIQLELARTPAERVRLATQEGQFLLQLDARRT